MHITIKLNQDESAQYDETYNRTFRDKIKRVVEAIATVIFYYPGSKIIVENNDGKTVYDPGII